MAAIYSYQTLRSRLEGEYAESGSKFLAYAIPVTLRMHLEESLTEIKSLHPKARHHCYAYRLLERDEITEYSSDAGEPSGSAGLPILGELKRQQLVNVIVIVVRYFGGTKLGIPGLIHAYRESTSDAIRSGEVVNVTRSFHFAIAMPISLQPKFYSGCKQNGIEIGQTTYQNEFTAEIVIPMEHSEKHLSRLLSYMAGREGDIAILSKWLDIKLRKMDDE